MCFPVSDFPPARAHLFVWRMLCAGFRHSAGFHARVVLDGAACRLGDLGELDDVPGVLGADRVVPAACSGVLDDVLVVRGKCESNKGVRHVRTR